MSIIRYTTDMTIRKALITSAGFGTRFLPITKTIQKEMLPVLNRPLIDYVVEDCVKAGIEEIIFVISEHNRQLLHFYRENKRLYEYLERMGKIEKYETVRHLHEQAKFTFVKQSDADQYGTATPVRLAESHLKDEDAFLVFMGDDFVYNKDGSSEAQKMIDVFTNQQATALCTCIERPDSELHKYGIAQIREENGTQFLKTFIEKPDPGTAPSNLSNISKYIFTPEVFSVIAKQRTDDKSGELYITDTITTIAEQSPVVVHTPKGEYLDGGSVESWLKANLQVAWNDPELQKELRPFLESLTKDNNE